MMGRLKQQSLVSSALLLSCTLQAQPGQNNDLFDLSLEELLNITIVSKISERVDTAPGVIKVITEQEIKRFGGRNLKDILDRQINTQVIGSNLYPHNRTSVRGVTQTHTDNKVLLLLNGRVVRDANQGGINSDIYNLFPIELIKKIEIVRGPGSVLYGTNAFSAVINVVTNQHSEQNTNVTATLGSHNKSSITANWQTASKNSHNQFAINYTDTDGDTFESLSGEFGSQGDYLSGKSAKQALLSGKWNDFNYNALLMNSTQGNIKSLYQFPSSELEIDRRHIDLGYSWKFGDWDLNINHTYNYHQVAFDISNSRKTRTDSQDYLWDLFVNGKVNNDVDLIFGLTHEKLRGTIGNISDTPTDFDTYRYGFYSQLTWNQSETRHFVVGGQLNKAEFSKREFSPRFSFVQELPDDWYLKILYGEAFRSPFATDMFLDSTSLKGNRELLPEVITTWDLQLITNHKSYSFAVTGYKSHHKQLHVREVINQVPTFINKGELDYWGLELESSYHISHNTKLLANASYQNAEDELAREGTTYSPETMIKVGVSHNFENGVSVNLFNSYFSESTPLTELGIEPQAINSPASSYHLLTFNTQLDLARYFETAKFKNWQLTIYLDNLLDEEIYFTSFNRTNVNSFPHHDGRSAQVSLNYQF